MIRSNSNSFGNMIKPLLVFDLNGVLICKKTKTPRPFVHFAIDELQLKYDIAVFTSCKQEGGMQLVLKIFTQEQCDKLKFIWFRDKTRLDPDFGVDPTIQWFDTIKHIDTVLLCPIINEKRIYTRSNVLFIDDSHIKMRFNGSNRYVMNTYEYKENDDDIDLLCLPTDIDFYFNCILKND